MHAIREHERWDSLCHDMRTPLSAILGISQILMTPYCPPQKQAECVSVLRDSAIMLKALVDDMLEYARLESGKLELAREPFSPTAVLTEAARIASVEAEAKGVSFHLHLGFLPPEMTGDALRLKQIALNLLSNAVKFTAQGFVSLEAWAEPRCGAYELTLRVTDSGIGIAPDRLEKVFGRFTQAEASINQIYGGSGLGLAICRELARLMGGDIAVESKPGEGSRFTATLRLDAVMAMAA